VILWSYAPNSNNELVDTPRFEAPRRWELRCLKCRGGVRNGRQVSLPGRLGVQVISPAGSGAETQPQKTFWWNFSFENASDSSNFHYFSVGKKCWSCSRGKIVPGQNDTFVPVVPRVPETFSRCPCEVGTFVCDMDSRCVSQKRFTP